MCTTLGVYCIRVTDPPRIEDNSSIDLAWNMSGNSTVKTNETGRGGLILNPQPTTTEKLVDTQVEVLDREKWGLFDDNVLLYVSSIGGGALIIIVLFCVLCCVISMNRQQLKVEGYQDYDFDIEMHELGHARPNRAVAARVPEQHFIVDSQEFSFESVEIDSDHPDHPQEGASYPAPMELLHH